MQERKRDMTKILIDEAVVRQALEDFVVIKYGLEKSRIWGGMDWTYNPIHPVHYLPLRDKADVQISALHQALADAALDKMADNARELGLDYMEGSAEQYEKELEQPAQKKDIPDLIAGALGVSRGTAYDLMREALAEQPAKQEPVAYIHRQGNHWEVSERFLYDDEKARGWTEEPLYTHPAPAPAPAQQEPDPDELTIAYLDGIDTGKKRKPWVGLTNEERRHLRKCNQQHDALALAVEALLKEKNT
jgi:hypothetical protein